MRIITTGFDGLYIIEPTVWKDDRGYFFESYSKRAFAEQGIEIDFVQDNEARSSKGVLRGLHYQCGDAAQTKLVRVSRGKVLDVVLDIRPSSKTYGNTYSVVLSEENKRQLLVPRGFAHGYVTLEDNTIFQYKCDNFYNKESEGGISCADPSLAIDWLLPSTDIILSDKDKMYPNFGEHKPFV